jgi:hypothetical protein
MLDWLKRIVALAPREQLTEIEHREASVEERLERLLRRLGTYNRRTASDLEEIITDLAAVLDILEKIIATLEHIGGAERARELRRRLRNHRTRASKAYQSLTGARA